MGESTTAADLSHQVDAAIVRLLKRLHSMKHQDLFVAVSSTLRKSLDAAVFKQRVESLIERDYICRDTSDSHSYKYVA